MKKLIFSAFCVFVCAAPAFAAPVPPTGYPPALEQAAPAALPPVDYISPDAVTLTDREKKALQLSDEWARRNVEPVLTPGGKIVYVHGATLPTIVAVPYQVCDVELEPGETVNEIVVGDSARWLVDSGTAGAGASATVHLFVKPMDAGLETSAVVTTDRRVYHLRFVSKRNGHTPYVGFAYADSIRQKQTWKQQQDAKKKECIGLRFFGHVFVDQAAMFTASFWMARTADGVL